ncbi:methyltransferase domain-containing protein [Burkholderia stagnalis]|uniref:Methyltransferase n=1 Tax=Burkholderia stagnalis TaxID=1503054 RepID=A0A108B9D3_9BURK|nr:methyltransferase domain-containing protein [Burkholderia stagnalis]AOK54866.1 methyltransferase [Burkholderia stagnalis]KVD96223.1 methyltransferase [Burkholderia stagnalis]KVL92163.1 methyltransferase [Burkholderia stagnalis]KVM03379.1 methyltransferase [Burkholderia stagnalis]KVM75010.1 methyltransferase [Burkholderia stagnalis]
MKVGHDIDVAPANWTFTGNVADTFVDHVRRSVPYYDAGHDLVCQLSDFFCHGDSICYEIGVSTGQLLRKLAEHHASKPGITWVGIDPVESMIAKARQHCIEVPNIELEVGDARLYGFEKSDLIVSFYCIQFIPPKDRQDVFNRIYERLNWGGAFILFEKVRAPDARFQDMVVSLYNDYKRREGFTADEILNKTASLKSVLEPFSTEGNLGLLKRAGFVDITTVMKYLCFEGFLAIK